MTAPPAVRREQLADALARPSDRYAPFTVREYADSDWQSLDWCTDWPAAPTADLTSAYSDVPVLVLSGELDTITTPAEGNLILEQFPNAQRVLVRNSVHVTAVGDTDDCAQRLVRAFVAAPSAPLRRRCAREVPPVRALGAFPAPLRAGASPREIARLAALTVADLPDRWWSNYSGRGVGLHGGRWRWTGDRVVRFGLDRVRLARGLAVSGSATWDRDAGRMTVDLTMRGGHLTGHWDTRTPRALAHLRGELGGRGVRAAFPAP